MTKVKNKVMVELTQEQHRLLLDLAACGLFGDSVKEVAEFFIMRQIDDAVTNRLPSKIKELL